MRSRLDGPRRTALLSILKVPGGSSVSSSAGRLLVGQCSLFDLPRPGSVWLATSPVLTVSRRLMRFSCPEAAEIPRDWWATPVCWRSCTTMPSWDPLPSSRRCTSWWTSVTRYTAGVGVAYVPRAWHCSLGRVGLFRECVVIGRALGPIPAVLPSQGRPWRAWVLVRTMRSHWCNLIGVLEIPGRSR